MKIENIIKNNKEAFTSSEMLSEGHEKRFEDKLLLWEAAEQHKKSRIRRIWYSSAAAVIILSILLITVLFINTKGNTNDEMAELEMYYNAKINEEINKLYGSLEGVDMETRAEILLELEKINEIPNSIPKDAKNKCIPEKQYAYSQNIYSKKISTIQRINNSIKTIKDNEK
ncbi:MAG: hypothetical protein PHR20_00550 [Bacteroidales bacterium]|nr:hypothetical protein [Bacteroidales bacterium]